MARLREGFQAIPLKLMTVVIVISAVLLEWYPFSCFPMYSKFRPEAGYVYLTDAEHNPIPVYDQFGFGTASLRKIFRSRMGETRWPWGAQSNESRDESESDAALRTLKYILKNRDPKVATLIDYDHVKLWRARIVLNDGDIETTYRVVGELSTK